MQNDAGVSARYCRGCRSGDSSASTPITVIKRQRSTIFSTYAPPEPPLASAKIERDRGGTRSAPWQSDGRTLNPALNPVANLRRGGTAGHAAFGGRFGSSAPETSSHPACQPSP